MKCGFPHNSITILFSVLYYQNGVVIGLCRMQRLMAFQQCGNYMYTIRGPSVIESIWKKVDLTSLDRPTIAQLSVSFLFEFKASEVP